MNYKLALYGNTYSRVDSILKQVGLSRSDLLITNDPSELLRSRPNITLALGAAALQTLTSETQIEKWRGSLLLGVGNLKVLPTYDPQILVRGGRTRDGVPARPIMVMDFRKAIANSDSPELKYKKRSRFIPKTIDDVWNWLEMQPDYWSVMKRVAVDIETERGQISCIGFAKSSIESMCIPLIGEDGYQYWTSQDEDELYKIIRRFLAKTNTAKIGQNFAYDMTWLERDYGKGKVENFIGNYDFDTLVAMNTVFPEFPQSLAFQTSIFTDIPYFKDDGKQHTKVKDYPKLWNYNCNDVLVTYESYENLTEYIADRDYARQFEFAMDTYRTMHTIARRGIRFDSAKCTEWRRKTKTQITNMKHELNKEVGHEINPASPKQLKDHIHGKLGIKPIYKRGTKNITLDENALKKHAARNPDIPLFEKILRLRKEQKFYGTYLGIRTDDDNRIRCSYGLAETGRLRSSTNPFWTGTNLQNQPKRIRELYLPDPGHQFVEVDLSQAEARIVAYDSDDANYISLFERGGDIHKQNAANIFGLTVEEVSPRERQLGKKISHATNYGMGPRTMCDSIIKELGTGYAITQSEAKQFQSRYHDAYPGVARWHKKLQQQLADDRTLTNCFGRRRFFMGPWGDGLFKEAYAFIPQSTVADLLMTGLLSWENQKDWNWPILLQVHDSVLIQVALSKDEFFIPAHIMGRAIHHFEIPIAVNGHEIIIPIDGKVGMDWKNMEDIG